MRDSVSFVNAAYFHIVLVHVPVVLTPLSAVLLAVAHLRKCPRTTRTALAITIIASTTSILAFLLGEPAEEVVEHLAGISKNAIEAHEEIAEYALWCSITTGVLGALSWLALARESARQRAILTLTFCLSALSSLVLAYTAHQGGKIHHPEAFLAAEHRD